MNGRQRAFMEKSLPGVPLKLVLDGGRPPVGSWEPWSLWIARPICLRLLTHCERRPASRAACTAGSSRAISTAMMAMTTSSSMSVNAERGRWRRRMGSPPDELDGMPRNPRMRWVRAAGPWPGRVAPLRASAGGYGSVGRGWMGRDRRRRGGPRARDDLEAYRAGISGGFEGDGRRG